MKKAVRFILGVIIFFVTEMILSLLLDWQFIQQQLSRQLVVYLLMLVTLWPFANYFIIITKRDNVPK